MRKPEDHNFEKEFPQETNYSYAALSGKFYFDRRGTQKINGVEACAGANNHGGGRENSTPLIIPRTSLEQRQVAYHICVGEIKEFIFFKRLGQLQSGGLCNVQL